MSVYVTNFSGGSGSTVSQYDVGAGGALTPKSPATVATGFGPAEVAVSPSGASVYVTNYNSASNSNTSASVDPLGDAGAMVLAGMSGGRAATTSVGRLVIGVDPFAFVAVTLTWISNPVSASTRSYEFVVAPPMSVTVRGLAGSTCCH